VTTDAYERVARPSSMASKHAGAIDGVYLDLHARWPQSISTTAKGEILARVREAIRPRLPLVVSLDLHAKSRLKWWSMLTR